jgi:hypothetical protein
VLERTGLSNEDDAADARKRWLPDAPDVITGEPMEFLAEVMREEIDRAVSR